MTVAVVLHFRTPVETSRAVQSLVASTRPPSSIVVVDNDAPGPADGRLELPAGVIRIVTGRNLGFPAGINAGIAEARRRGAGRLLLVNSDATLEPAALERLEAALDTTPEAGIAGPVVLFGDRASVESMGIRYHHATGRMRLVGHGRRPPPATDNRRPVFVDAIAGCVMLVDAAVFDAVGVFDEAYFYGFEDLDFCLRARRSGFGSIVVGDARARHEGSRSIGAQSADRLYYAARNHLRLAGQGDDGRSPVRFRLRQLSIVGLNAAQAFRAPVGRVPARVAAVARGVQDYRRGRFGPA